MRQRCSLGVIMWRCRDAVDHAKTARVSLLHDAVRVESLTVLSRFRTDFYDCLTASADALFELADAVLCTDGPVRSLVDLALAPEHRRGHGSLYAGLNRGRVDVARLRRVPMCPTRSAWVPGL